MVSKCHVLDQPAETLGTQTSKPLEYEFLNPHSHVPHGQEVAVACEAHDLARAAGVHKQEVVVGCVGVCPGHEENRGVQLVAGCDVGEKLFAQVVLGFADGDAAGQQGSASTCSSRPRYTI